MRIFSQRMLINTLLLAALLILARANYVAYQQIQKLLEANTMVLHTHKVIETADKTLVALAQVETLVTNYFLLGDKKLLLGIPLVINDINQNIYTLHVLTNDNPMQQKNIDILEKLFKTRIAIQSKIIQQYSNENKKLTFDLLNNPERLDIRKKILAIIGDIVSEELHLLSQRDLNYRVNAQKSNLLIIQAGTLSALLFLISIILLNYHLYRKNKAEYRQHKAERELIKSNKKLLRNKQRYDLAVKASNTGLWTWEVDTGKMFFSANFEHLLGYENNEFSRLFSTYIDKIHPEDHDAVLAVLNEHIENDLPFSIEYRMLTKSGDYHWYLSVGQLTKDDNGLRKISGSLIDITERKKIDKMKNEFISVVNHELRTPLTSIHGAITLLTKSEILNLSPDSNQLLLIAKNNCERLIRLITDMLDIEKIELGKMNFNFTRVSLIELINVAVQESKTYAIQKSIIINIVENAKQVYVNADRDRILQAITNLLSNAIKFSHPNSEVTICVDTKPNHMVRLSIIDHGNGIPTEFHSRIFQKFSQADSSDTRKQEGTGLGLSISKMIIEKHGGTIGFTTKINQGSVFYFDLPICSG